MGFIERRDVVLQQIVPFYELNRIKWHFLWFCRYCPMQSVGIPYSLVSGGDSAAAISLISRRFPDWHNAC
jgi:hypothetical protein